MPFYRQDSSTATKEYQDQKEYTLRKQRDTIDRIKLLQSQDLNINQFYIQADANRALLDSLREQPQKKKKKKSPPVDTLADKTARLSAKNRQVRELRQTMQKLQKSVIQSLEEKGANDKEKAESLISNIDMERLEDP